MAKHLPFLFTATGKKPFFKHKKNSTTKQKEFTTTVNIKHKRYKTCLHTPAVQPLSTDRKGRASERGEIHRAAAVEMYAQWQFDGIRQTSKILN